MTMKYFSMLHRYSSISWSPSSQHTLTHAKQSTLPILHTSNFSTVLGKLFPTWYLQQVGAYADEVHKANCVSRTLRWSLKMLTQARELWAPQSSETEGTVWALCYLTAESQDNTGSHIPQLWALVDDVNLSCKLYWGRHRESFYVVPLKLQKKIHRVLCYKLFKLEVSLYVYIIVSLNSKS